MSNKIRKIYILNQNDEIVAFSKKTNRYEIVAEVERNNEVVLLNSKLKGTTLYNDVKKQMIRNFSDYKFMEFIPIYNGEIFGKDLDDGFSL